MSGARRERLLRMSGSEPTHRLKAADEHFDASLVLDAFGLASWTQIPLDSPTTETHHEYIQRELHQ